MARGTGLGMVFEEERGDPSPCTETSAPFTAQALPVFEVLQESQDSHSDTPLLSGHRLAPVGCVLPERRCSTRLASRLRSALHLSAGRPEEMIAPFKSSSVLYLLILYEKSPFVLSQLALWCYSFVSADHPLPGRALCSSMCGVVSPWSRGASCPTECTAQSRMVFLRQGQTLAPCLLVLTL